MPTGVGFLSEMSAGAMAGLGDSVPFDGELVTDASEVFALGTVRPWLRDAPSFTGCTLSGVGVLIEGTPCPC